MKPYFGKQVIEAARSGSGAPSVKVRHVGRFVHVDGELEYEGLTRIPTTRKAAKIFFWDCKDFSDKLGPLHNFLRSSCGRLWNDVYSEMSKELHKGNRRIQHIMEDHLDVTVHTYRGVDGNVWACDNNGGSYYRIGGPHYWRFDFYVEPETGILREHIPAQTARQNWRRRRNLIDPERRPIGEGKEYKKIDGLWFYAEYHMEDVYTEEKGYGGRIFRTRSERQVIEFKRQLGKKDLKALELKNG